jgi:hypothetical protein
MLLDHALTQLAILGATSLTLRDGRVLHFDDAEAWLGQDKRRRKVSLHVREWWTDIIDDTGNVCARAVTLWGTLTSPRSAVG